MEIIPNDATLFKSAIEGLKDFLPEAQILISSDGLAIRGMDAAHVGYVNYFLSASDCSVWKVPKACALGISMAVFANALGSVSKGGTVSLSQKKEKLVISYTNESVGKDVKVELHLMDIDQDALEIPPYDYPAVIKSKTVDIAGIFKEVGGFSDSMTLRLDEKGFHVSAKGDQGSIQQMLKQSMNHRLTLKEDAVEATYGTKYILSILKAGGGLSPTVQLDMDPANPLCVSFLFGSSHMLFYLAPKVGDD